MRVGTFHIDTSAERTIIRSKENRRVELRKMDGIIISITSLIVDWDLDLDIELEEERNGDGREDLKPRIFPLTHGKIIPIAQNDAFKVHMGCKTRK